ncbi:cob(II)yrinic acid a,c-diamide reductase [Kribbella flavida DSM 17836]|uniref:Cob(II)yrinic acid a,c-diamide reductase n=1 Tax=Kribbella flavida (strain DSM 17836 / JCM 10339 / NBRC 14399) TaxID=479435 RepID=D2Q366_KRIFD|nr:5,6-dimethylbenzimidazole synthase [Kribbella flavida]ADB32191.1 cob(II)yrinic acid a,c-diamide reductase [Kribbella flavida DSM 17836]
MSLVLGIGLRAGTPYRELRELVDRALAGLEPRVVSQVVTVDGKEAEPGLQRLVASLGAQLFTATALELGQQPVPTPSERVDHLAGTASVAEAAVILSGADLVVPKLKSAGATVAVGRLSVEPDTAAPGYAPRDREVVHRVIAERRDVRRGFLDRPIADDLLTRVLEAAHRAPSVGLSQPWDFLLVRDVTTRRKIHDLASAQRDAFAASLPPDRRSAFDGLKIEAILDTPLNIAVTCDPGRGGRHVLGRHADPRTTWFSAAIAVQNLWLAARAEGLGVGWVSFFEPAEVGAVLDLPAHVELVGYLCVGHVEEFAVAPELVRSGWAARRPLSWAVHQEQWGQRGLPGETASPALAVEAAVEAAESPGRVGSGEQVVRILVVDGGDPAEYLRRAETLVVQVGAEKPAADFGVLWRPARRTDEAVELGVEVARDLVLQGVGEFVVQCQGESDAALGLVRGIRWGGLACGVSVKCGDQPDAMTDSSV